HARIGRTGMSAIAVSASPWDELGSISPTARSHMATNLESASIPPRRFTFHGPVRIWDPTERRLRLGGPDVWLSPEVEMGNLALGTEGVAKGYEGQPGDRWIVDLLTVTSTVKAWRRSVTPGNARRRL